MANPDHDPRTGAPPREVHVEPAKKGSNWWLWLLPLLLLLGLLFLLSRCDRDEPEAVPVDNSLLVDNSLVDNGVAVTDPGLGAVAAPAAASGLTAYLAGTEPVPRTFVFERLNFESANSTIRPADREEVTSIASALKQRAEARIRVVGFTDARGASDANADLGKQRAESVKAALVAEGVEAARIETASGGEAEPVASNSEATGQAENRRTEFVVLQR